MIAGRYGARGALRATDGPELGEGRSADDGRLIDALAGVDVYPKVRIHIQMVGGGQAEVPLGLRLSGEIPPGGISQLHASETTVLEQQTTTSPSRHLYPKFLP